MEGDAGIYPHAIVVAVASIVAEASKILVIC
jgi:hypothetical protein